MNQFLNEFVPQDVARRMRAVNFNEPCLGLIMGAKNPEVQILSLPMRNTSVVKTWGNAVVPTYREAFKWLREMVSGNRIAMTYTWSRQEIVRNFESDIIKYL